MRAPRSVPEATIKRMTIYYRFLEKLSNKSDLQVISSQEMEKRMGISANQIRKDLSYFGEFGKKGIGYNIEELVTTIGKILGIREKRPAVLVGAGNLGRALVNYGNFKKIGLSIEYVFDADLSKIGNTVRSIPVLSIRELNNIIKDEKIQIGIITVSTESAQEVAEQLVEAGIKAIWNFAPLRLKLPGNICIRNEDLAIGITSLIHYLNWNVNQDYYPPFSAYE